MKGLMRWVLAGVAVSSIAAIAAGANGGPRIVELAESNGSNTSARALLDAGSKPNTTRVDVILEKKGSQASYSAALLFGACEDPAGVAFALNAVQNGKSSTQIPGNYLQFDRPYALVLKASDAPGAPILACGTYYDPSTR